MAKITYLVGAGASVGCLPIVNSIPEALEDTIIFLSKNWTPDSEIEGIPESNFKNSQQSLMNDLAWLKEHASRHTSVDTFAKKIIYFSTN